MMRPGYCEPAALKLQRKDKTSFLPPSFFLPVSPSFFHREKLLKQSPFLLPCLKCGGLPVSVDGSRHLCLVSNLAKDLQVDSLSD